MTQQPWRYWCPPRAEGQHVLVISASRAAGVWATQLMSPVSQVVASPAACGRQDDCPLPHPRCRHFCFQTHAPVGFLRVARLLPLTRCTGLGWDGASAFALRNANGCWWVSGRALSCPPAYDGQRHPLHIPSAHVTSCGTKLRIYPYPTITNAASVVLWPKALDDHLYPVAALYLA